MKVLANLLVFGCLLLCVLGFTFLCICVWGYQTYGWIGIVIPALGLVGLLWLLKVLMKMIMRWTVMRVAQWKGSALQGANLNVTAISRVEPTESGAPVFDLAFTIVPGNAERFYDPAELLIVPEASTISYDEYQSDDTIGHLEHIAMRIDGDWTKDFDKVNGTQEFRARLVITGPAPTAGKTDGTAAQPTLPLPARVKVQNWFAYIRDDRLAAGNDRRDLAWNRRLTPRRHRSRRLHDAQTGIRHRSRMPRQRPRQAAIQHADRGLQKDADDHGREQIRVALGLVLGDRTARHRDDHIERHAQVAGQGARHLMLDQQHETEDQGLLVIEPIRRGRRRAHLVGQVLGTVDRIVEDGADFFQMLGEDRAHQVVLALPMAIQRRFRAFRAFRDVADAGGVDALLDEQFECSDLQRIPGTGRTRHGSSSM